MIYERNKKLRATPVGDSAAPKKIVVPTCELGYMINDSRVCTSLHYAWTFFESISDQDLYISIRIK